MIVSKPTLLLAVIAACALLVTGGARAAGGQEVSFSLGGFEFLGDGPDAATVGVGAFNVIPNDDERAVGNDDVSAEFRAEYRLGEKVFFVGPMLGLMVNSDGGVFGYGGIYGDVRYRSWVFTPAFGVGGYSQGDSKDLGGVFEFHVGLDIAYEFDGGSRLGLKLAHISNAGTQDINPGVESALLTYTLPLGVGSLF